MNGLPASLAAHAAHFWSPEPAASAAPGAIAVVTAFFDIDRGAWSQDNSDVSSKYRRGVDFYFECFHRLAALNNDLVLFTAPNLAARALDCRKAHGLAHRTTIFVFDNIFAIPEVAAALGAVESRMTDCFKDFVWRPTAPEYNKADYVLINALKSSFACTAIEKGAISAPQLAWIDFGYPGEEGIVENAVEWNFDFGDRINLFNVSRLDDKPIYDIVRRGEAYMQGCHIVGPTAQWPDFNRRLSDAFRALLACDLVDDDQTMLLMAFREEPEAFILRQHGIDPDYGWRFIFRRFQRGLQPQDADLPPAADKGQPAWLRDLKTLIRRRLRAKVRTLKTRRA